MDNCIAMKDLKCYELLKRCPFAILAAGCVSALVAAFAYGFDLSAFLLHTKSQPMPITNLLAALLFNWLALANYKEGHPLFGWLMMTTAGLYSCGLCGLALGFIQ